MTQKEWQDVLDRETEVRNAQEIAQAAPCGTKKENVSNESDAKKRGLVAREALDIVNGARQDAYGNPEDCFVLIGDFWNAWGSAMTDRFFSLGWESAMRMALLKIARIAMSPQDRDSYRDAIGYLALACDMAGAADKEKD